MPRDVDSVRDIDGLISRSDLQVRGHDTVSAKLKVITFRVLMAVQSKTQYLRPGVTVFWIC